MAKKVNPVVERLLFWDNRMKSAEFREWLFSGDRLAFFQIAKVVADSVLEVHDKVWFDFVDGIIGALLVDFNPKIKVPYTEGLGLAGDGFKVIIKYLSAKSYQKSIIDKNQYRTDVVAVAEGITTKINSKSLAKFNEHIKNTLLIDSDVFELRDQFIVRAKNDYQKELPEEAEQDQKISQLDDILKKADFCYKVLMTFSPPIISEDFRYLLGSRKKSAISAWIDVLKERGYLLREISDKDLVPLINSRISGLNLGKDGRLLRGDDKSYQYFDFRGALIKELPKYQG